MNKAFKKVAILGSGLLGGSIALAVRRHLPDVDLVLWARDEKVTLEAKEKGIKGATSNFNDAVSNADLVILATPVGVMAELVKKMMGLGLENALITDVGSVKRIVHSSLKAVIAGSSLNFIGSHPMAGSEKTGFGAAMVDLLEGAACIITNDDEVEESRVLQLKAFWEQIGCRTRSLSAEDHDYAVARISHFPHMMASVAATVGLSFEDIAHLAGGGMRDTTRVAAGSPSLWTEILLENADALQRSLGECITELAKVQEMLRTRNNDVLKDYLIEAKRKRELI